MSRRGIPIRRTGECCRTRMNGARRKMVDGVNLLKNEGNRGMGIPALKGSQVEISKHRQSATDGTGVWTCRTVQAVPSSSALLGVLHLEKAVDLRRCRLCKVRNRGRTEKGIPNSRPTQRRHSKESIRWLIKSLDRRTTMAEFLQMFRRTMLQIFRA
jgi:hypothetical protein